MRFFCSGSLREELSMNNAIFYLLIGLAPLHTPILFAAENPAMDELRSMQQNISPRLQRELWRSLTPEQKDLVRQKSSELFDGGEQVATRMELERIRAMSKEQRIEYWNSLPPEGKEFWRQLGARDNRASRR